MDEIELIQTLIDLKLYAETSGQFFLAHLIGMAVLEAKRGRDAMRSRGKDRDRKMLQSDH